MAPRQEPNATKAQGKSPTESPQPKAHRNMRFDTALFNTVEECQQYKQHFFSHMCSFGEKHQLYLASALWIWEIVHSDRLIVDYYDFWADFFEIISTVRGVEIHLDPESICCIFDVYPIGLRVYEPKIWPTVPGFEPREAIQRICGLPDTHGMGKPSIHSLMVIIRVLHQMFCFIFLP